MGALAAGQGMQGLRYAVPIKCLISNCYIVLPYHHGSSASWGIIVHPSIYHVRGLCKVITSKPLKPFIHHTNVQLPHVVPIRSIPLPYASPRHIFRFSMPVDQSAIPGPLNPSTPPPSM